MSLETADAKLAAAFDGPLARAVQAFSGSREVAGEYDPETGTSTTTVTYSGRGVFYDYSVQEVDGNIILATDTKLIALQQEVTLDSDGSPATPQEGDAIDGMEVVRIKKDAAGVVWELTLRRT